MDLVSQQVLKLVLQFLVKRGLTYHVRGWDLSLVWLGFFPSLVSLVALQLVDVDSLIKHLQEGYTFVATNCDCIATMWRAVGVCGNSWRSWRTCTLILICCCSQGKYILRCALCLERQVSKAVEGFPGLGLLVVLCQEGLCEAKSSWVEQSRATASLLITSTIRSTIRHIVSDAACGAGFAQHHSVGEVINFGKVVVVVSDLRVHLLKL